MARVDLIDRLALLAAGGASELTVARVGYLDNLVTILDLLGPTVIAQGTLTTDSQTVPADNTRTEGNDHFKNCILIPRAGAIAWQPRPIRTYTSVGGIFELDEPFTALPGLVTYYVIASDYPVQRLIDIFADVGDASGSTLGSLYGIVGNPAAGQDLATRIGYQGATSLADKLTAARAALLDRLSIITAGGAGELTAARAGYLDYLLPTTVGKLQIKATTIDLNQAAGTYDLFTGTTQDVVIEKLTIRIPVDVSAGACDSISIQTDDTTNQLFISAVTGAKANLTAQAQLGWTGVTLIKTGKKIQLTIAGAATGIACSCDVIAEYRAVIAGGYLS